MATLRYYVEQAPDRFYDTPAPAKARAARMSKNTDNGVYVIAEQFSSAVGDYESVGSVVYYGGFQDAREGIFA